MTKLIFAMTAILASFISNPATAQMRADELLWECEGRGKGPELMGKVMCVGYISGIMDGIRLTEFFTKTSSGICAPDAGISNDQATRLFMKRVNDNPKVMSATARIVVYGALAEAFPCTSPGRDSKF